MMDIKDIQEQAFERGREVGRREAIEERLAVLKGVELGEGLTAVQVVEDLARCRIEHDCIRCRHNADPTTYCVSSLMYNAEAVIKTLLCGGAEADANATGAEGTNVPSDGVKEKLVELLNQKIDGGFAFSSHLYESGEQLNNEEIASHLIANGVTVQEWIPVAESLPEYFEHVLINVPGDKPFTTVHEAHLRKDNLWDTGLCRYHLGDVTHWMSLPEPPKGE